MVLPRRIHGDAGPLLMWRRISFELAIGESRNSNYILEIVE